MRSAGVDIATSGKSAIALALDGVPKAAMIWEAKDKKDSEAVKIFDFYRWLVFNFRQWRPDYIAVEQVAGFHNRQVIQALSRFEGAALVAAKRSGAIVLNPRVSSSRAAIINGLGNAKKEVFFAEFKKLFSDFDFGRVNSGGMDKADAMTHALAAPIILERRK